MNQKSPFNIGQLLQVGEQQLLHVSDSPRLDVELLLGRVLNKTRAALFAWPDSVPSTSEQQQFLALLERRVKGEPVSYLLGEQEFWSLRLKVTPDVLIPRPETELLVEKALELIPKDAAACIADVGTGSGAIALALATERSACTIVAIDISEPALRVAQDNAFTLGIRNVMFQHGKWLRALRSGSLDMVVSNPPYIASSDPHLQQGDVRFEPVTALVSGDDGLLDIRALVDDALRVLKKGGWFLCEHGWDQGAVVQAIFEQAGFVNCQLLKDLSGHDRVSLGQKSGE